MKQVLIFAFLFLSNLVVGQEIEMADKMRADGKIYVVVAVLVTVFIGVIVYLIIQDGRIRKVEKELENIELTSD